MLDKSNARIAESIKRVAKKQFKDDAEGAASFVERWSRKIGSRKSSRSDEDDENLILFLLSSLSNMHIDTTVDKAIVSADLVSRSRIKVSVVGAEVGSECP